MSGVMVSVSGDQPNQQLSLPFTGRDDLEGAGNSMRETALWRPSFRSPDQIINVAKPMADARGRDVAQNDPLIRSGVQLHKDTVVGSQFTLVSEPNYAAIQASPDGSKAWDEVWQSEFAEYVEARFSLIAESENCWLDASGINTFTGQVRMAVGSFVLTGEVLAIPQWNRDPLRPYKTCVQMISPDRLCNPYGVQDSRTLRRGITKDQFGKPVSYSIRNGYPNDYPDGQSLTWTEVPAVKPWGRKQVIHIIEQLLPDQSRGVAEMVAALKQIRMMRQFNDVTLQNAVINAMYAAAIESELPPDAVFAAMGGGAAGAPESLYVNAIGQYMNGMAQFVASSSALTLDGAKIPHLPPGSKLNFRTAGTPGGVGTPFEDSLVRKIAATLGVSYEGLSRDFSKVSYSSARAALVTEGKFIASRKKMVADRYANQVYALQVEEMFANGEMPLPAGVKKFDRSFFYLPLMKEALCACSWIGSGTSQIDELKETQAAILRLGAGLTAPQMEHAKFGFKTRNVYDQIARAQAYAKSKGLEFDYSAARPLGAGPSTPGTGPIPEDQTPAQAQQAEQ